MCSFLEKILESFRNKKAYRIEHVPCHISFDCSAGFVIINYSCKAICYANVVFSSRFRQAALPASNADGLNMFSPTWSRTSMCSQHSSVCGEHIH